MASSIFIEGCTFYGPQHHVQNPVALPFRYFIFVNVWVGAGGVAPAGTSQTSTVTFSRNPAETNLNLVTDAPLIEIYFFIDRIFASIEP